MEEDVCLQVIDLKVPMPNLVSSTIGVAQVIDDLYNEGIDTHPQSAIEDERASHAELITSPNQLVSGKMVYGGGEYYPTLQRTLYILGRMYGSVPVSNIKV